jgi:GTP-binding protein
MIPTIAIVGRPNTGKSTLFNRILGTKFSITFDESGTTRDRVFGRVNLNGYPMIVVDTGGLEFSSEQDSMEADIQKQSMVAIEEADVIMFVVNAAQELTATDYAAAKLLRESGKPVVLVASKCDNVSLEESAYNLYELGFDKPIKTSAIHNNGLIDVENALVKRVKKLGFKVGDRYKDRDGVSSDEIRLSFVGKPNVGKSSLVNRLLGKERVVVSDTPGTTRDSISLEFEYDEKEFLLVDTAGFKRSGKRRGDWLEKFTVLRSLQSIEQSDVAVLVIDSSQGLTKQDMRVSEFILEARKGLIVVMNKADLVKPEQKNRLLGLLQHKMAYMHFAPVIFTSALTGTNTLKVFDLAISIAEERKKRVKTRELNYFLERTIGKHPPKPGINIKFIEQVDVEPPTFIIFVNHPDKVHFSYRRYIENELRKEFGFSGTAIEIKWKKK